MKTCLINECERKVECRGLCHPCYQSAWRYIKSGSTTWEALEAGGFALPAKEKGIEKGSFRKALEKEESIGLQEPRVVVSTPKSEPNPYEEILQGEREPIAESDIAIKNIRGYSTIGTLPVFEPFEQGDYDPPDEAQTGCGPPEPNLQGVIETLDPSAPEPLFEPDPESEVMVHQKKCINQIENSFRYPPEPSPAEQPDPQIVAASMTAIEEGRTQPIENFFRYLPDLHSGREPG